MLRLSAFLFIVFFCSTSLFAQDTTNLVVNHNLEEMTDCPNTYGDIWKVKNWYGAPYTTDFFSTCAYNEEFHSPNQTPGFAWPHSGINFAGIILTQHSSHYYDYLIGSLKAPLVPGKRYTFSIYARLAAQSPYSSDWMSVFFCDTNTLVKNKYGNQVFPFDRWEYVSLIPEKQPLRTVTKWVQLQANYVAQGGEKYFWIGGGGGSREHTYILPADADTFRRTYIKESPRIEFIDPDHTAYYYLDDAFLYADSVPAEKGIYLDQMPDCAQNNYVFSVPREARGILWYNGSQSQQITIPAGSLPDTVKVQWHSQYTLTPVPYSLPTKDLKASAQQTLRVYPNPGNGDLHCQFSANASIENAKINVYDFSGKEVQHFYTKVYEGNNHISFSSNDLSAGIYVLEAVFSNCKTRVKFCIASKSD